MENLNKIIFKRKCSINKKDEISYTGYDLHIRLNEVDADHKAAARKLANEICEKFGCKCAKFGGVNLFTFEDPKDGWDNMWDRMQEFNNNNKLEMYNMGIDGISFIESIRKRG